MTFHDLNIDPRLLSVLDAQRITIPTPIQAKAIPVALEGRDALGLAQTGTGKTLAYALPSLMHLANGKPGSNQMLVLLPTRELCQQVFDVVSELGKPLHLKSVAVYGGTAMDQQTRHLRKGCSIVVATPGRLLDHMTRGNVQFNELQILVLDEADRMLDMGFWPDIQRIVRKLTRDRQTLLFSATFPNEIMRIASELTRDAERVEVGTLAKPVDSVTQRLFPVRQEDKSTLLIRLLREEEIESAVIFLRTKDRTERLALTLKKQNFKAARIHGDRSQRQRDQALDGFRSGRYRILVATDVASRGLDVEGISHVINYDIPLEADAYIHRIGRTARAEQEGEAITFVTPSEMVPLEAIEKVLGKHLPREEYEGAPVVLSLFKEPGAKSATAKRGTRRTRRRSTRRR